MIKLFFCCTKAQAHSEAASNADSKTSSIMRLDAKVEDSRHASALGGPAPAAGCFSFGCLGGRGGSPPIPLPQRRHEHSMVPAL